MQLLAVSVTFVLFTAFYFTTCLTAREAFGAFIEASTGNVTIADTKGGLLLFIGVADMFPAVFSLFGGVSAARMPTGCL